MKHMHNKNTDVYRKFFNINLKDYGYIIINDTDKLTDTNEIKEIDFLDNIKLIIVTKESLNKITNSSLCQELWDNGYIQKKIQYKKLLELSINKYKSLHWRLFSNV